MKVLSNQDFDDGLAVIRLNDKTLELCKGELVIASAPIPNAGRRLSAYAFANGAQTVRFDFDLRKDEL